MSIIPNTLTAAPIDDVGVEGNYSVLGDLSVDGDLRVGGGRPWFDVDSFLGSETARVLAAVAAAQAQGGGYVILGPQSYGIEALLAIPDRVRLFGANKYLTQLTHAFNGDMMTLGSESGFGNLTIEGQGATYSGKGVKLLSGKARQSAEHFQIINFAEYCLDFQAIDAGSQSSWFDGTMAQLVGSAIGQEAIHIVDTQQLVATPRKFIACESNGKRFMHLGGSADTFLAGGGYIGELVFTSETRGLLAAGVRLGGLYTAEGGILHIKGFNHSINGDFGPNIEIDAGYSSIHLDGTFNGTVTDNSGFPHLNSITTFERAYVPTFTSGGTAPALGNGTLTGNFARHGAAISFSVELVVGSTTTFGTGDIRFSLPITPVSGGVQPVGGYLLDASTTINYLIAGIVVPGTPYVNLRADVLAGAVATGNWPGGIVPATGDIIRISGSYQL